MNVYRQKPLFSIFTTHHTDTPKDDFPNDEIYFYLIILSPKVIFIVASDQTSSKTYK